MNTASPPAPRRCAFLGLGVMGYPMAGHLARAGHAVTVYNRTAAKAQAWVAEHGGRWAATPREAARDAEFVFACVGNDDDLRSVVLGPDGANAGMAGGAVFVDHTTASAKVARELHDATSAPMADGTRRALDRETTLPREMMRSLGGGYAYNYREGSGEDTGKRRYGVMAQDLERTPMGASIVQDTPRGKMVDTRQATGTLLASVSDLQKQLDELKARRGHG